MFKLFKKSLSLVVVFSALFSISSAQASPDELDKFIVESSLFSHNRIGNSAEETKKLVENRAQKSRLRFTFGGTGIESHSSNLVKTAFNYIGVPYKFGGTSAKTGLDCSAFVQLVYSKAMNLDLPRVAADQARATKSIEKAELQPGDLIFFNTRGARNSHVGIYVGENKFIHAPRSGAKIRIEQISSYWVNRWNGARRVTEAQIKAAQASTQEKTAQNEDKQIVTTKS